VCYNIQELERREQKWSGMLRDILDFFVSTYQENHASTHNIDLSRMIWNKFNKLPTQDMMGNGAATGVIC
jgi:hypothetical protein